MGCGGYVSIINITGVTFNYELGNEDWVAEHHDLTGVVGPHSSMTKGYLEYSSNHSGHFSISFDSGDGRTGVVTFSDFHFLDARSRFDMGGGCKLKVSTTRSEVGSYQLVDIYITDTSLDAFNNNNCWMGNLKLNDNRSVASLSMPGTHDSATYSYQGLKPYVVCQTVSVTLQLNMGVRFLDLRVGYVDGELWMYHGGTRMPETFDEIKVQIESFLSSNGREFVICSVKCDHGDSGAAANAFLERTLHSDDHNFWLFSESTPTIREARGKAFVLSRFKSDLLPTETISWPDNTTEYVGDDFTVSDNYEGGTLSSRAEVALNYLRNYCGNATYHTYYNFAFLNATAKLVDFHHHTPKTFAQYVNPRVYEYIRKDIVADWSGIVIMDFFSEYQTKFLTHQVILQNLRW
jgi:hypothetical protein